VDEWLYKPGLPKNCYAITSPRFEKVQQIARDFAAGKDIFKQPKKKKGKKREPALTRDLYTPQEWQAFIRQLPKTISPERLALLDEKLKFKSWGNAEVATEWYVLGIKAGYKDIRPNMEKFLMKIGRRKFLLPIYTALSENADDKKWALQVYEKARNNYHPVSVMTVDELLKYRP
jgi:hypothetical protein